MKESVTLMQRLMLTVLAVGLVSGWSQDALSAPPAGPYGDALWNRVHRALFTVDGPNGVSYGDGALDVCWAPIVASSMRGTIRVLDAAWFMRARQALDAFLAGKGDTLVSDPVQRAFFQRDLWQVFDLLAEGPPEFAQPSAELCSRLARILAGLRLRRGEIAALPNTCSSLDSDKSGSAPVLPNLLAEQADWISVGPGDWRAVAPTHQKIFGERSAFSVHLHLPGGREATQDYLDRLAKTTKPYRIQGTEVHITTGLPEPPKGTVVALVRRMLAIRDDGEIVPTPIVESVQIRILERMDPPPMDGHGELGPYQTVAELLLHRSDLLSSRPGLRPVGQDEVVFGFFNDHFQHSEGLASRRARVLHTCGGCHAQPGIYSVNSLTGIMSGPATVFTVPVLRRNFPLTAMPVEAQARLAVAAKKSQFAWGFLQGFWGRER